MLVVDSSVLLAARDRSERHHAQRVEVLLADGAKCLATRPGLVVVMMFDGLGDWSERGTECANSI